jgi:wobble nucleotide-excising tRNase
MSIIEKVYIDNFGSYKNFEWSRELGNNLTFKKINIIYGRNYSGKTTLSKIFQCVENKCLHNDYDNPKFKFILDDKSVIDNNTLVSSNLNICVYNTDFVKENLQWLHNEDGSIKPFTVLGENNNQVEIQI